MAWLVGLRLGRVGGRLGFWHEQPAQARSEELHAARATSQNPRTALGSPGWEDRSAAAVSLTGLTGDWLLPFDYPEHFVNSGGGVCAGGFETGAVEDTDAFAFCPDGSSPKKRRQT